MGGLLHPRGFPCGPAGKESSCNAGDLGSVPGLGRSPRDGKGYPLQYYGLETSMDCIGVAKHQTQVSDFHFHFPHPRHCQGRLQMFWNISWVSCSTWWTSQSFTSGLLQRRKRRYRHKHNSCYGQLDFYNICCFIKYTWSGDFSLQFSLSAFVILSLVCSEFLGNWWFNWGGGRVRWVKYLTSTQHCAQSLSRVQLFATVWTVAHQAPLSMGIFRQGYWSVLSFPAPGDFPETGIKLMPRASSVLQVDSLLMIHWERPTQH